MKRRKFLKITGSTGLFTLITPTGIVQSFAQKPEEGLEESFLHPPASAKPYTMWMWMNGHVTKEGITLDLEAIARVGLGGVFNFDAGTGIPKGPLKYLSPEWFDAKAHAFKEADRLGLEFTMHNCPGWSSSGGPWITPELSMKTLVWSKSFVEGGKKISISLSRPAIKLDFYKDVAVLAYPSLPNEEIEKKGQNNFTDWQKRTNQAFIGNSLSEIESGSAAIDSSKIILLTENMKSDGTLDWQVPAGRWTILRMGYTSLGTMNRSAPDTGVGLECDKYDANAISFHFNKMMTELLPSMSSLAKKGKMGIEIDSFEVGMQNWTGDFDKEFKKRNGYDLLKYLPTMTGKLVDNADTTEQFLWDLRRTQGDMLADNYYGKFNELCHQHGITTYYEPYDRGPMEEMQIGARGDSNMGEYWNGLSTIFQNNKTMRRTCKLISSIAHVNGQKVAGVEGLTGEPASAKWQEYAFAMKPVCDHIFIQGINRIAVHRYAHQPHPTATPGMTMGAWGIQFDRTNTMWEPNKAWMLYLARCQSLLQQGLFVADLAYFTGEDAGMYTKANRDELIPSPIEGYDFDLINVEVLLNKAKVVDGRLLLPDGMNYRVLVLQEQKRMSVALLQKLEELIKRGLVVVGSKPDGFPGLKTYSKQSEDSFRKIADGIWGEGKEKVVDRNVGNGKVYWGKALPELFNAIGLAPDFEISSRSGDAPIKYLHRVIGDADIYFLANQRRTREDIVCNFRVKGKQPELWDAMKGTIINAPAFEAEGNTTRVSLSLDPYASVFVVFRSIATKDPIINISKGSEALLSTKNFSLERKLFPGVKDNFSIVCFAKPEMDIMLSTDAFYENVKGEWTDFYTVYPSPGNKLYGEGHRTCGFAIGRNGVAIWENGDGQPKLILGCPAKISGWTHVAIVYEHGAPSVFVNGVMVKNGIRASANVHPGLGQAYLNEGASYYNGDLAKLQVHEEVLNEDQINALSMHRHFGLSDWNKRVEPAINGSWLFWENGDFKFSTVKGKTIPVKVQLKPHVELSGTWELNFPPGSGAPAKIVLPKLISLSDHESDSVKYFSGTCTYSKKIIIEQNPLSPGKKLFLDLGEVEVMAEVILNGKNFGIYWTRPYLVDITSVVKSGINILEVKVTNQWVNRLIGDEQLPEVDKYSTEGEGTVFGGLSAGAIESLPDWYLKGEPKPDNGRVAFSTWKFYKRDSPLLNSGLMGPVMLRWAQVVQV